MAMRDFGQPAARRAWVRELRTPMDEARWQERARELFAWQFQRVPAFQRLCRARGVTPETLKDGRKIPAVPQQLFKVEKIFSHGMRKSEAIYETSGTTTGEPGRQVLLNTDIYRAMSTEGARQAGLFTQEPELHFLTPSPREAPHSSLSAMFGFWLKSAGQNRPRFWMRRGGFEFAPLRVALEAAVAEKKIIGLAGTAFAFVHLLDAWADLPPLPLPRGSWLLETGGFKGRSREVEKTELYAGMARLFTVPDSAIWNEYGMSELSSQAYACGADGRHFAPPWARVLVWDAARNREARVGQRGLVRWIDLANVDSVLAVQTLDLAEQTDRGFQLIGRMARTEPRGCSLSTEDLAAPANRS